ncbi:TlpA disulfide reductase family protein [Streptomyces sp. NPDC005209]|uniref:TlpA family protein disulfide reductase n=1 Tax=Streptomyces sp. NPDC005209 TaxID=3156715 RepID=UPI0033B86351
MTKTRRPYAAAAAVAICAILAGCSTPAPVGDTSPSDPLTRTLKESERPAAPDFSGTTLEGRTVHLSDYRGKVVVVNAWASWCGPCRAEAPELAKVQRAWAGRGLQVLGLDNDHSRADGLAFQKDHHLGYPSLHDPSGRQALRLPRGLVNTQALPFTIVIDPAGKIAATRMGAVTQPTMARIVTPLLPTTSKKPGQSPAGDPGISP